FFFSRRGRHTRFSRDWSSDVCSSDLGLIHTKTRLSPPMCCNLPSPAAGVRDSTRVMVPETEAPWGARGMVSRSRLAEEDACTVQLTQVCPAAGVTRTSSRPWSAVTRVKGLPPESRLRVACSRQVLVAFAGRTALADRWTLKVYPMTVSRVTRGVTVVSWKEWV